MTINTTNHARRQVRRSFRSRRRGIVVVLSALSLAVIFGFVALAVDTGLVVLTKTNMQNAVDAAALAAAQEITVAVADAAQGQLGPGIDANSIATAQARLMAAQVALANGVTINPATDVQFGKRTYNEATGEWPITWGAEPYNVVQVVARRDQADTSAPNGKLPLYFGWAVGKDSLELVSSATAFVEARDLVVVLDFSGSMNYDSQLRSSTVAKLGQPAIEANLRSIWEDLDSVTYGNMGFTPDWVTIPGQPASGPVPHIHVTWKSTQIDVTSTKDLSNVVLQFTNGSSQKFDNLDQTSTGLTGTFQGTGSYAGKIIAKSWIKSGSNASGDCSGCGEKFDFYDTDTIKRGLGLDSVAYPFPSGSWSNYIDYVRDSNGSTSWYDYDIYAAGFRRQFGMMTFINFLFKRKERNYQTPVLWKTRHYPFNAVKEGTTLLTQFLADLDFGDQLGLVSYDTYARVEYTVYDQATGATVDLGTSHITNDYAAINTIQRHKQAAHYYSTTNIGAGLHEAIGLLQTDGRYGARPTILLMTDGNANVKDNNWSLPADWNWNTLTDYDGDGVADYTTSNSYKLYAFGKAKEAIDQGFTIHTLAVGATADRDMMRAIAFAGGGIYIDVPGGANVNDMEDQMLAAFSQIAAKVPPAKLVYELIAP